MTISEAVKKALEVDGIIYREEINEEGESNYDCFIRPTNSYATCIIYSTLLIERAPETYGFSPSSCPKWNPTADDLIADDWEALGWDEIDKKFGKLPDGVLWKRVHNK